MNPPPDSTPASMPGLPANLKVVRYSLPALLREVEIERTAAAFAMEKLDQGEIAKIFQKTRTRRVVKNRK